MSGETMNLIRQIFARKHCSD